MAAPPELRSPGPEEFYLRWIADLEIHRAECPACRSGGEVGCADAQARLLGLARADLGERSNDPRGSAP